MTCGDGANERVSKREVYAVEGSLANGINGEAQEGGTVRTASKEKEREREKYKGKPREAEQSNLRLCSSQVAHCGIFIFGGWG